jgi:hypothetical protein
MPNSVAYLQWTLILELCVNLRIVTKKTMCLIEITKLRVQTLLLTILDLTVNMIRDFYVGGEGGFGGGL